MIVSGLTWARRHKREFEAVITIEDPRITQIGVGSLRFHHYPRPDHLVLSFYDLDEPIPEPYHQPWMRLADHTDIAAALAFAHQRDNLLVHCKAGVSRSTAIALAILMAQLGDPQTALETVLKLRPIAVPNRHVTMIADDLLGCHGTLITTLDAWDKSTKGNATRRYLCRIAHFVEFGIPLG
jgi:predicted protein tyrosine phosphatase